MTTCTAPRAGRVGLVAAQHLFGLERQLAQQVERDRRLAAGLRALQAERADDVTVGRAQRVAGVEVDERDVDERVAVETRVLAGVGDDDRLAALDRVACRTTARAAPRSGTTSVFVPWYSRSPSTSETTASSTPNDFCACSVRRRRSASPPVRASSTNAGAPLQSQTRSACAARGAGVGRRRDDARGDRVGDARGEFAVRGGGSVGDGGDGCRQVERSRRGARRRCGGWRRSGDAVLLGERGRSRRCRRRTRRSAGCRPG